jgi:hypothetical protein
LAAGANKPRCILKNALLHLCERGDVAVAFQVKYIGMAADGSGCRAGCIKQHGIKRPPGLPLSGIRDNEFSFKLKAVQVLLDSLKA